MTQRKCYECQTVMRQERGDYHYEECGLPNVSLVDIVVNVCDQCGARTPEIYSIAGLHRAIMIDILKKETLLCGPEVRFLRKMARMTAAELGKLIGADSTSISKWENGTRKIGPKADRVLRLVCYAGMLERMLKASKEDEGLAGFVAATAKQVESLDVRKFLSKIENKMKEPKRVMIRPDMLAQFGAGPDNATEEVVLQ